MWKDRWRHLRGRRTAGWRAKQLLAGSAVGFVFWGSAAVADPEPQTLTGVPQQIIPEATEVGLPPFTMPSGNGFDMGVARLGPAARAGRGRQRTAVPSTQCWGHRGVPLQSKVRRHSGSTRQRWRQRAYSRVGVRTWLERGASPVRSR